MRATLNNPVSAFVSAFLGVHLARLRAAWRQSDRGASAVELAVITAMILVVAVVLLLAIQHFVRGATKQIRGTTP